MSASSREPQHSASEVTEDTIRVPLFELLSVMRRFHQVREVSHHERFGTPDRASQQALSELDEALRTLQRLAAEARYIEMKILVDAQLGVTLTGARQQEGLTDRQRVTKIAGRLRTSN